MNINNTSSCYINYNTLQVTSKKDTTVEDRREICQLLRDETLYKAIDFADLQPDLNAPLSLASKTVINTANNSISLAEGASITVSGGYVLTVNGYHVEVSGGDPYNQVAKREAGEMASALTNLLRNAGGTMNIVAFSTSEYQNWTENVSKIMKYFGIDTSKDFTVNGVKYSRNENGWYESQADSEAKAAYEMMTANNRTYTFADERTRNQIAYISNYYLENTTESLKAAWQKTLEETGVNPFPQGFSSTLSQLAMEQDFATGGDDDVFGSDLESNIAAVRKILERLLNPLNALSERNAEFAENEKTFYTALLNNLS